MADPIYDPIKVRFLLQTLSLLVLKDSHRPKRISTQRGFQLLQLCLGTFDLWILQPGLNDRLYPAFEPHFWTITSCRLMKQRSAALKRFNWSLNLRSSSTAQ